MQEILKQIQGKKNFIFIGEAGSGKSEIAINFARYLKEETEETVHFFDMDMTKPLYRSRDAASEIESIGIVVHYEKQFADAPTAVGGVQACLRDEAAYTVMDVGGDYIGARSIGAYAMSLNGESTAVYYVLNAYRPWSDSIEHIDRTLGEILGVSHIDIEKIHIIHNPNTGKDTTVQEVLDGNSRMREIIGPYKPIDFVCVREDLFGEVKEKSSVPVMPVHLYLTYEWLTADENEEAL